MTVQKLHRLLGQAIEQGHARTRVAINKPTFAHALEGDGCVILDVEKGAIDRIPRIGDDGGTAFDTRGQERSYWAFVLDGGDEPAD